jgi:hypothetical protein
MPSSSSSSFSHEKRMSVITCFLLQRKRNHKRRKTEQNQPQITASKFCNCFLRFRTCGVQNQNPEDDRPPARPREAKRTSPHLTALSLLAAAIATGLFEASIEIEQMFHNAFYRPSGHKQAPFLTVILFFLPLPPG